MEKKIVKKTYSCGIIWLQINIHSSASFSMEWVWKVAFCLNIRPLTNTNTLLSKQHITSYYHMPLQRWIYEPNTLHLIAIKNSNMPNCWLLASCMTFPKSRFEIQYCAWSRKFMKWFEFRFFGFDFNTKYDDENTIFLI